jgi:hypothetical protein
VPPPANPKDIEEVDVEGLDYQDDYLWLVGSHSLKRKKADENESVQENFKRLSKVRADGNRFLLARIPVAEKGGVYTLRKEIETHGKKRTAAQLRGDNKGNDLTKALREDEHLKMFFVEIPRDEIARIPGKDNGFDIEGLAVAGERLFIGLRGPVLRGWALILEVDTKKDNDDPSTLELKKIGPDGRPYRKHFLSLRGLGIRDLCVQASDLLILAGPTMNLDGPTTIFRWRGGARPRGESLVFAEALPKVMDVPFGEDKDHAEGMTLFSPDGGDARSIFIVYDSASDDRKERSTVKADIFALPQDR